MMRWEFSAADLPAEAIREAFRAFGFVLIRNVLDRRQCEQVRSWLDHAFGSGALASVPVLCTSEALKCEALWGCLFAAPVVSSLRAALGLELCYQNDLHVQRNSFGQAGLDRYRGWHMDAGSETHNDYLRSTAYRFAKCGIFLQDFDNGWGGGIQVKPKSHRRFFEPGVLTRRMFYLRRACDRIAIRLHSDLDSLQVPTRAGDLCFFDSRLLHCSVLPSRPNVRSIGYDRRSDVGAFWPDIPRSHTKYVIYWNACNEAMVADFLRNSVSRAQTEPENMQEQPSRQALFTRYLSVSYPRDYPAEFIDAVRRCELTIGSLAAEHSDFYKQKLRSMRLLHP